MNSPLPILSLPEFRNNFMAAALDTRYGDNFGEHLDMFDCCFPEAEPLMTDADLAQHEEESYHAGHYDRPTASPRSLEAYEGTGHD